MLCGVRSTKRGGQVQHPLDLCLRVRPLLNGLLLCPRFEHSRLELCRPNQVLHLPAVEHMVDDVGRFFLGSDGHSESELLAWGVAELMRSKTSEVMSHGSLP